MNGELRPPRSLIRAFTVRLQNDWILQSVWMESKGPRAVGSGPSLSGYRMIGYYRVYEWRAKAPAQSDQGLHCPLTEWLITTECMNGEQRPPRSLIRAFTVRLQNDWILQSVRIESKGPRAVWSGPSLSAYRMIGYYRVYEWRAKAPAQTDQGLHCPLTEWLDTTECTNGEQRLPRSLIRAFIVRLQNDWILQSVWMESKGPRAVWSGPSLSAYRMIGYYWVYEWRAKAPAQSDQGLHCSLTEWLATRECTNGEQRPGWYFVHGQDDLNLRILRIIEGTFSLHLAPLVSY